MADTWFAPTLTKNFHHNSRCMSGGMACGIPVSASRPATQLTGVLGGVLIASPNRMRPSDV